MEIYAVQLVKQHRACDGTKVGMRRSADPTIAALGGTRKTGREFLQVLAESC